MTTTHDVFTALSNSVSATSSPEPAGTVDQANLAQPVIPVIPGTYPTIHGPKHDKYFGVRHLTGNALNIVLDREDEFLAAERPAWNGHAEFLANRMIACRMDAPVVSFPHLLTWRRDFSVNDLTNGYPVEWTAPVDMDPIAILNGDRTGCRVVLDLAELAAGKPEGWTIGEWDVRPDGTGLVYTDCPDGSEIYTVHLPDGTTGPTNIDGTVEYWGAQNHLLLIELDDAQRPFRVIQFNPDTRETVTVYESTTPGLTVSLTIAENSPYVQIAEGDGHYGRAMLFAEQPDGTLAMVRDSGSTPDTEYTYIHDSGVDLLLSYSLHGSSLTHGVTGELIYEAENGETFRDADTNGEYIFIDVYRDLDTVARVLTANGEFVCDIAEPNGDVFIQEIPRGTHYAYVLVLTAHAPVATMRVDLTNPDNRETVHTDPVNNFNADDYTSDIVTFTATDGTDIPVTLIYRTDQTFPAPVLLSAYGAYGENSKADYWDLRVGVLDAGVVAAVAYVRGGGELGIDWHAAGRRDTKMNTFTDLVDVATGLREEGYASRIVSNGGSAGGATVTHAATLAPHLFDAVVAEVPFVDALATMHDDTLPLTVGEYVEWGDPNTENGYRDIASWSPNDNIIPGQIYPPFYISVGLNDPRVGFWEGLKLAALVRDAHPVNRAVVRVDRESGHTGGAGYKQNVVTDSDAWGFALHHLGILK